MPFTKSSNKALNVNAMEREVSHRNKAIRYDLYAQLRANFVDVFYGFYDKIH